MNLRIPDDVIFRNLEGEAVILNLATGTYFGLDPVGTRIWQLIEEFGSTEKIAEMLLAEYDVAETQLRTDLDELVRKLLDQGLVKSETGQ